MFGVVSSTTIGDDFRDTVSTLQPVSGDPVYVGASPYVFWVEQTTTPLPPLFGECCGRDCIKFIPDAFVLNGALAERYTCGNHAKSEPLVPDLKWSGFENGGADGRGRTFAVTVTDLDEPYGRGSLQNHVSSVFWAVNIPSDWSDINEVRVASDDRGVIMGRNSRGVPGMQSVCPQTGSHRLSVALWVLDSSLQGIGPDTPYVEVIQALEAAKLAQSTVFAKASAPASHRPGVGSFLRVRPPVRP